MATRFGSERKRKGKAPSMFDSSVRRRKPLSDCSNTPAPRKSSSAAVPKPTPIPVPSRTRQVKNSSVASNPRTHLADPASAPTTPSPLSGRSERSVFQAVSVPVKILAPRKSSSSVIPKPSPNPVPSPPSRTRQVKNSTVASNPRTVPAHPASAPTRPSPLSGRSERSVFHAVSVPVKILAIPKPTPNPVPSPPSRTRQVKNSTFASNPRTLPAHPASAPTRPSPVSGRSERSIFMEVSVPVSSVFKRLRDDLGGERVDAVTKPDSKPRVKKTRSVSSRKESSKDMAEYVRQQKSYFEEVDAFELLVEEASDEELE